MAVPNVMSKAFTYQDLDRGALCPRGMIRQKYPGAGSVKDLQLFLTHSKAFLFHLLSFVSHYYCLEIQLPYHPK